MLPRRIGIDRRQLLRLGAAAPALALTGCGTDNDRPSDAGPLKMRYRPLGRTGLQVSEIAFGAHGVENQALMRAALEAGINTFCTSGSYLDGKEERALSEVLRSARVPRDKVVIFTGDEIPADTGAGRVVAAIDASLRRLGTDYIDVFYTAQVASVAQVGAAGLLAGIDEAKRAGKVRHLALSCHTGGMQDILNAAMNEARFEVFFIKYDFVSYPDLDATLRRAAQKGIGTVVFKTTAGNRQREIKDLEAGGLSFRQATLKWALQNPDVASAAVTATSYRTIRECVEAVGRRPSAAEIRMMRRYAAEMADKYCRFCATCEDYCPRGVAVADVMRFAMYFSYYGREKEAMRLYRVLPAERRASECASCSAPCERACPFRRSLHAELVNADRRLLFEET